MAVSFSSESFDTIEEGLKKKFGPPSNEVSVAKQNRYGAQFDDKRITWIDGDGNALTISRYSATTDKGLFLLQTNQEQERVRALIGKTRDQL